MVDLLISTILKIKNNMKKLAILVGLIGSCAIAQSQGYTLGDLDGNLYENNGIYVFVEHADNDHPENPAATMPFVAKNTSDHVINLAAEFLEITNTDGTNAQFCFGDVFGNCFLNLKTDRIYPVDTGFPIQPGMTQGVTDHLLSSEPNHPTEYKLRFFQVDADANQLPGTDFIVTYRYDPNMAATSDVNGSISIAQVYPTVASGFTNVNLKENASVSVVNVEGKVVKNLKLSSGVSKIDLSGLPSGIYIISFKGQSGLSTTTKLIVK